jgi:tetratricopeptide (TPR) repeat protein
MTVSSPLRCLAAAWLAAAAVAVAADDLTLWRDPEFQKQFLGSYGMRAEIEPPMTAVEGQVLGQYRTLMAAEGGAEKAMDLLAKSAAVSNCTAQFDFILGQTCFQRDDLAGAAAWFGKAIAKHPAFLRAQKQLGLVYVRSNAFDRAIGPLTRAIDLGAADDVTFGLLAHACSMTDQPVAAEGAYRQALMLKPDALDWKLGLVRCLFKQRKFEEAAALCGELVRRDSSRADYWLLQANAWIGLKLPLRAAANYEILARTGQANTAILNALGDIYLNENAMDLAADAYLRALARDPATAEAGVFIRDAEVLAMRGGRDEAARVIVRVRETFGERLGVEEKKRLLKLQARLAAAADAVPAEQAALLEETVALDPLDGEALILLAQHHARQKDIEKAVFLFERAEGMEKFEAEARLRHGQMLVKAGRYQDAVPLLKRAQELKPRDDIARYLEQVERAARTRN